MAIDMFLKVEGIEGESKNAKHLKWIDVVSFNWGAKQPGNVAVGGGGGSGKVNYQDLTIQALIDKSTPALLKYCSTGKHLPKLQLSICKSGGQEIEYTKITLEEVLLTATEFIGQSYGATLGMAYSFQAGKVSLEYSEQTADGGKGPSSIAGWDIKQNKEV
ncbi:type VI secretion system tube protein Hcp [Serratia sp. JUb9]|uniref:Hcp family type VI secretion system effector n=1 Tax=unclassified Serratia (in: enterobacteria) TaxID=2647522 RepID=UPI000CF67C18|nr:MULTISPECIES: type VI secretion system tube protein Hcp [unclassified Serratia (in: enterobacteria)]MBU3891145.1 type VI secretion system tube protein Hcp [Serratia rubidaea]AVJ17401.1 type VI secretion system tube protein Hcp [Serratia sp. MYb239]MCA4822176.1 type VI secretion system tube protein Hcp [Serratia rubidaea]QNK30729.1 type VI secretion system tube protein Hcp [Serratia sp. JUb9]QPT15407.1 type VI secretion system tube protein Hcp [Serratia rubidaea]